MTQGYLLVVDLQGVNNILTDPQVHCLDKARFGKGNLGYLGILMFFNTHVCNEYCKFLGLVNPRDTPDLPKYFKLLADIKLLSLSRNNQTQKIQKLCDLCRTLCTVDYHHYIKKRLDQFEVWCDDCTVQRDRSMTSGNCKLCFQNFKFSAYWYKMKRSDNPVHCFECRYLERERMRNELEGKVLPLAEEAGKQNEAE